MIVVCEFYDLDSPIVRDSWDLQWFLSTGATGLEPATFGFGDRRNARQANGSRAPWGHGGDEPGIRNMEVDRG